MDPRSLHQAASELLARALELPQAEQRAFLSEECKGNKELEREVLALHDRMHTGDDEIKLGPSKPLAEPAVGGTVIGDYRIMELLGEGGMGQVFRAYKETPPKREVALKLIRAGIHSRSILARFDQERNALTVMSHPNIAGILDAGETAAGQPYFVMELVPGTEITGYCDRHRLSIRERLELFDQVCEGVQHAHQKGIIHRDLKPSNILVVEVEGRRTAKIIDFGVAKATEQTLTEQTLFTEMGVIIGTPEYMSPEQAETTDIDIDTRSDVYSLGVLLYELLTGSLPFDRRSLQKAGLSEIYRIIREEDPAKPSTRVARPTEENSTAAERRGTKLQKLAGLIRGDLDWIVMKALEKDRSRRYASPLDLAADLKRHLRDEPVHAGPPSTVYRMGKFIRRNRLGVGTAAVAAVALIVFTATLAVQKKQVIRERNRAEQALADREAVVAFQSGMLAKVDPGKMGARLWEDLQQRVEAGGTERGLTGPQIEASLQALERDLLGVNPADVARQILKREILAPAVEEVNSQFQDQPMVEADLLTTLAKVYQSIALYPESETAFRQGLEIHRTEQGDNAEETVAAKGNLAGALYSLGRWEEAESLMREVVQHAADRYGPDSFEASRPENFLALLLTEQGRYDEALPLQRRSYERSREVFGPDDDLTIGKAHNLGMLLMRMGQDEEAEMLLRDNFERVVRLKGRDAAIGNANMLAGVYTGLGRYAEAESLHLGNLEAAARLRGRDSREAVMAMGNITNTYLQAGDPEKAEPYIMECLERAPRVLGEDHPNMKLVWLYTGRVHAELGRPREAEGMFMKILAEGRPNLMGTRGVAAFQMARIRASAGRAAEAWTFLEQAADEGFDNPEILEETPALASLRDDPAFQEILEKVRENAGD